MNIDDEATMTAAEQIYADLLAAGVDVIIYDRDAPSGREVRRLGFGGYPLPDHGRPPRRQGQQGRIHRSVDHGNHGVTDKRGSRNGHEVANRVGRSEGRATGPASGAACGEGPPQG